MYNKSWGVGGEEKIDPPPFFFFLDIIKRITKVKPKQVPPQMLCKWGTSSSAAATDVCTLHGRYAHTAASRLHLHSSTPPAMKEKFETRYLTGHSVDFSLKNVNDQETWAV